MADGHWDNKGLKNPIRLIIKDIRYDGVLGTEVAFSRSHAFELEANDEERKSKTPGKEKQDLVTPLIPPLFMPPKARLPKGGPPLYGRIGFDLGGDP